MSNDKLFIFALFVFFILAIPSNGNSNFLTEEVRSLSQLPMERLIWIKASLLDEDGTNFAELHGNFSMGSHTMQLYCEKHVVEDRKMDVEPDVSTALTLPMALPLKRMSSKKSIRRHEDYWEDKGKDTKISKIFQLAITALSFLAFGGYLLTLIITAIRRNANAAGTNNVIVLSSLQNLQKYKRPKRRAWMMDPMENDCDIDKMYRGMIIVSRGYAMYNYEWQ